MAFPLNTFAGSAGNRGEVAFYYEDSGPSQKPESEESATQSGKIPTKHLSLPQTGEKKTSSYLVGAGIILLVGIWFWKQRRSKEGSSED